MSNLEFFVYDILYLLFLFKHCEFYIKLSNLFDLTEKGTVMFSYNF